MVSIKFSGILLLLPALLFAQKQEGVVIFEQKVNLHKRLSAENENMKAFMPEFQVSKYELHFNASTSLFKPLDDEDETEVNSNGMQMRIMRPENIIFRDFEAGSRTEQREFLGKKYLIEAPIKPAKWKMTTETKKIQGYTCTKAILADTLRNAKTAIAWYTDALPCPSGPESFGGLPGMVLEADIDEGSVVFTATQIEFKKQSAADLKAPREGKKITEDEYRNMVEERMKEMGAGRGMRIIRN